jgi:hypothetical protein
MTRAVLAVMALDLLTFALAVPLTGIGAELNPVARAAWDAGGLLPVAAIKAAAAIVIVLLMARSAPPLRRTAGMLAAGIATVGVAANLLTLAVAA